MKRKISAGYPIKTYPDVWDAVTSFGDILSEMRIDVNAMENRTEEDYQVERMFKSPEQAEAYIEALQMLGDDLKEIAERFKQISGIED